MIFLRQRQKDRRHNREAELEMAYSKQQQMHFNRIHEVVRNTQASFVHPWCVESERGRYKHTNTDLERKQEQSCTGLTLPVSHGNAGRQQTLSSNPSWCSVHFLSALLLGHWPLSRELLTVLVSHLVIVLIFLFSQIDCFFMITDFRAMMTNWLILFYMYQELFL